MSCIDGKRDRALSGISVPTPEQPTGVRERVLGASDGLTAVDGERGASGESGVLGAQPQHGGGDLLGLAEAADGFVGDEALAASGAGVAEAADHLGVDDAGADGVDTDPFPAYSARSPPTCDRAEEAQPPVAYRTFV